ncbi:MAG: hypothetical protein R2941_09085 [Desulfobacterales bacterium]
MPETHDDVIKEKKLPRVGDTVKSKKYGTLWRVIEKKEVWENTADLLHLVPAIYLTYRKVEEGKPQLGGRIQAYAYTLYDTTFETNWEVVKRN